MYDFCQSKLKDTVDHINVIQKILFVFKVYIWHHILNALWIII